MKKLTFILIISFAFLLVNAQSTSPQVKNTNEKDFMLYPWAGGMNSCQFGEIDLNMDGIMDLFVFDRHGDRIMTFINEGIADSISYVFDPEYASYFPELCDWVILRDYDNDGKQDIFTYSKGFAGVLVYRNVSKQDHPEFELMVYPFLTSLQGSIYTNILVTYADYPAIIDLDEDGDLDILTFWGLGSFVELHQNMSMEKYGHPDTLDYQKVQYCWGNFAESDETNHLYMDTCVGGREDFQKGDRHTGSTFFVHDMNGDNAVDLVLGDVDYPDLVLLTNGGTSFDAHMESQDWNFPSGGQKVNLFSMPAAAYIDIDNDQQKEMIVSPFDPGLFVSENHSSVWLYDNEGEENDPDFNLLGRRFLQDEMIDVGSGAYPAFFDYNNDGLQDLVVGNYGYYDSSWYDQWLSLHSSYTSKLALFENTGTTENPEFERVDYDYLNLSELEAQSLIPAFGDLDGDEDMDMVLGNAEGTLFIFLNIAPPGDTAEFEQQFIYWNSDVGEYSAPAIYDLDKDGLMDIIVGERKGNLNYFKNIGTAGNMAFEQVTDSLGKINVTDFSVSNNGFSVPFFFQYNNETKLIVGSEQGKLFYFDNIDGNHEGEFTENDSLSYLIDEDGMELKSGMRTSAAIADLNNDSFFDLIAGNFSGGLRYFSKDTVEVSPSINELQIASSIHIYPNPASDYILLDLKYGYEAEEVCIYDVYGRLLSCSYLENQSAKIDISDIPAGVYLVRVLIEAPSGESFHTAKKLIIR